MTNPPDNVDKSKDKQTKFVDYIFAQCEQNKGFRARMRRADNPALEYQSWEILSRFNIDLEYEEQRLPYALIAAAIAQDKQEANGDLTIGSAIYRACYQDKDSKKNKGTDGKSDENNPAYVRFRRLLGCDNVQEVCQVLRPLLKLIQSRVTQPLNYVALLKNLTWFNYDPQQAKARWATQFYSGKAVADKTEEKQ